MKYFPTFSLPFYDKPADLPVEANDGIRLHPAGQTLGTDFPMGPFTRNASNQIVGVGADSHVVISDDEGQSWQSHRVFPEGEPAEVRIERAIGCSDKGVLTLAFMNGTSRRWTWSDETGDAPGCFMSTNVIRSIDGGQTWQPIQVLHPEWTGAIRTMIRHSTGRMIFTTMKMRHNPGRHTVMTYGSDDHGLSWQPSNIIDLGGAGHHGGVTESTVFERADGSLVQLLRTNWCRLWRAVSNDHGVSWHPLGPTGIDASSAPPQTLRLASGKLLLVWNRIYEQGKFDQPMRGGDNLWSATPTSNYRQQLSAALSEDDGETWTNPVVIAGCPSDKQLSYPYLFEPKPGTIWLTTMFGGLRMSFDEASLTA